MRRTRRSSTGIRSRWPTSPIDCHRRREKGLPFRQPLFIDRVRQRFAAARLRVVLRAPVAFFAVVLRVVLRAPVAFFAVRLRAVFLAPVAFFAVRLRVAFRAPVDFFAAARLRVVFRAPVAFFAVRFRPVALRAVVLRAVDLRAVDLRAVDLRAVVFLAALLRDELFFVAALAVVFFAATLPPRATGTMPCRRSSRRNTVTLIAYMPEPTQFCVVVSRTSFSRRRASYKRIAGAEHANRSR